MIEPNDVSYHSIIDQEMPRGCQKCNSHSPFPLKREMSFDSSFCAAPIALIPPFLAGAVGRSVVRPSMSRLSLGAISRNERTDGRRKGGIEHACAAEEKSDSKK